MIGLPEIKNYLNITWDDPLLDNKITGIAERAERIISDYAGAEVDFLADQKAAQLALDCIRYIYNNAYEDFAVNFRSEIIMLRAGYSVDQADAERGGRYG